MKSRSYLLIVILLSVTCTLRAFDSRQLAARHSITVDKPAPGFFEGALLGNGGLGVLVPTRPDAICLHFVHSNVWDVRIAENTLKASATMTSVGGVLATK